MRILIAEDDPVSRSVLERFLRKWGHEVVITANGAAAWKELQRPDAPSLAILDWMMPEIDGPGVCRLVRALPRAASTYLIILTARHRKEDVVAGLESGADDYITKPFDQQELQSRIRAGERIVELQHRLAARVSELESALAQVKTLSGLLPICCYCKKIRSDSDYWEQVETYLAEHTDVHFSHGICPHCWKEIVEPQLADIRSTSAQEGLPPASSTDKT